MYLAVLSAEEKELFLGLAYKLSVADGEYSEEEKAIMQSYCHEMQCEFDVNRMVKSIDQLINRLNEIADLRVKKIVIFEAIGLTMADGIYGESERTIISNIETFFGVEKGFAGKCENILNEYISFQTKINQLILG